MFYLFTFQIHICDLYIDPIQRLFFCINIGIAHCLGYMNCFRYFDIGKFSVHAFDLVDRNIRRFIRFRHLTGHVGSIWFHEALNCFRIRALRFFEQQPVPISVLYPDHLPLDFLLLPASVLFTSQIYDPICSALYRDIQIMNSHLHRDL